MENTTKKQEWHFKNGEALPKLEAKNYLITYIKCNLNSFNHCMLSIKYRDGVAIKTIPFNPIGFNGLKYPFANNSNYAIVNHKLELEDFFDTKFEAQPIPSITEYDFIIGYSNI